MRHLIRITCVCLLTILLSCSSDNKIVEVVSGNIIRLSSGDEIHLINVANSRNNYDYLCLNLLWHDVLVVEKSREVVSYVKVIHAIVYTTSSECINDMLEKETPLSFPVPEDPKEIITAHDPLTTDKNDVKGVPSTTMSYEMPKMLGSVKSQIISHSGYTVSYNADYKIANWVAYELTATEAIGTVSRSNAWAPNPSVNGPQAEGFDYNGSGWDRGHLAPAGDMKWSSTAMDESFYYTNIVPQNKNLNGGDWRILEENCRELAKKYEKVYIASGGIVKEKAYGTIGKNKVTVPDAFFKVLLTEVQGTYSGIGFYFRNEAGHLKLSQYARTIDEIEQITNMDFFSALPDEIEKKVESGYNLRIWNL